MRVDKTEIIEMLRARGEHDRATSADCALPRQVDTETDAGLLHEYDVHVHEIAASVPETPGEGPPEAEASG